jgi:KUP system potassium uptake protein
MTSQGDPGQGRSALLPLTLTAIGVVYGDIGTSPLYTIRECFFGTHSVDPSYENVLGILSLVLYALIIVVSIKYIVIVMRADNQGEGGILALTALLPQKNTRTGSDVVKPVLVLLGIFGAALLYGDGMITPAISILSATEGLHVRHAAGRAVRGAALGRDPGRAVRHPAVRHAPRRPALRAGDGAVVRHHRRARRLADRQSARGLRAIDPRHAVRFFVNNGWHGFAVLGAVFLAVTGGEALYADMGHFGRRPIRSRGSRWCCRR